ncbi:hypothetical protein BDY19DRAFT_989301 [Irpex rosettiformis]|uniref:Uncharacterized protein n=1 Tax=Irpex rosettiformis TaxID=378272 RepID=A0ACB8UH51_9APHY|nr:hypothetical protein BDY19DRAFT_989301 [Irpex rosettiformis]
MKDASKVKRTGRSVAKQAGRSTTNHLERSPARSANESGMPSFGEPSRRKAQVKVTYAGRKMQRAYVRRRQSLSSLSSMSSDSEPENGRTKAPLLSFPSSPPEPQSSTLKPKNKHTSLPVPQPSFSSTQHDAQTILASLPLTRTQSLSSLSSLSNTTTNHPGWDIEDHRLVFVRVDHTGNISENSTAVWWPAEVTALGIPMRVTLFGEYPGFSPKSRQRELNVNSSPSVILPFCSRPRQLRFSARTYYASSGLGESLHASPRKKQKTSQADLNSRWCDARNLMLKKYQDMNDGLPLTLSLHVRNEIPDVNSFPDTSQHHSARQSSIGLFSHQSNFEDIFWEPSESPYEIPGELVLAREKRTFTQYWPAKLMEYIPPQKRGEKAQYQVLFYDGKMKKLSEDSDMFYHVSHPNFKSCLLGEDENNYGLHIGERDEDTDLNGHGMISNEDLTVESLRSLSPVPKAAAPLVFASELSVEEQFRYVTPVLSAILTGQYEPARQKHVGFMKGGKQRNTVIEAAWKRGEVTSQEKEELSTCIVGWMRRRQRRQDLGLLPADPFVTIPSPCGVQNEMATHVPDNDESDDSDLTELTESKSTADHTERDPSSEVEAPPSSFITADDPELTQEDIQPDVTITRDGDDGASSDAIHDGHGLIKQEDTVFFAENALATEGHLLTNNSPAVELSLHPSTLTSHRLSLPPPGTVPTFAHLSDLDQFTYCTSVLLPEAILQILLWRNGERKAVDLLPPAEEKRLHCIAEQHASATYWVHDIVKLRHLAEGRLLPTVATSDPADPEGTPGNRMLRPRRK